MENSCILQKVNVFLHQFRKFNNKFREYGSNKINGTSKVHE